MASSFFIPLCYKLYCLPLLDNEKEATTPWAAIIGAVSVLIIGSSSGCYVRYKNDELGKRLEKICIKIGVFLLVLGIVVVCFQTIHLWLEIKRGTWLVGTCLAPGKFLWR